MPGSVQNAAPSAVMPQSLSRAFVHSREYPVIDNEYRNGESPGHRLERKHYGSVHRDESEYQDGGFNSTTAFIGLLPPPVLSTSVPQPPLAPSSLWRSRRR